MLKGVLSRQFVRMALGAVLLLGGFFSVCCGCGCTTGGRSLGVAGAASGCHSAGKAGTMASCRQGTGWNSVRGEDDAEGSSE